ncbi:MAG: hypothetical protein M5U28_50495 [Sandaracinaceae bacterium]|nr:hypothetical protein [Sandaracinaceae bacterium]
MRISAATTSSQMPACSIVVPRAPGHSTSRTPAAKATHEAPSIFPATRAACRFSGADSAAR